MTTNVLLADFQFLTRQGIVSLIDVMPDFQIIHEVSQSHQLEIAIKQCKPDLVVLDVSDNEILSVLKRTKSSTEVKFLALLSTQSQESIQYLLDIGIKGIVTKNCSKEEITGALKAVAKGERFFCSRVLDLLFDNQINQGNLDSTDLSPREYEVLRLIAKGNTSGKIAETLFLSVHTINSHRKSILKKLNMKSPTELIVYAFQNGLIENS